MMTLEDMEFGLESYLPKGYDPTLESANQQALSPQERKQAIEFFSSNYMGKFPIQYFQSNEKNKHDRIIAKVDIPSGKSGTVFSFMKALIWKINKKSTLGTFFYSKKDGYVLLNPKRILKKDKKENEKPVKESNETGLENVGVMDSLGCYEIESFRNLPLIQSYMKQGLNLKQAVDLLEAHIISHPCLNMWLIPESAFKTADDYDNYLVECFVYACLAENELHMEDSSFVTSMEAFEVANPESVHAAMEAVSGTVGKAVHGVAFNAKAKFNSVKNAMTPVAQKLIDVVNDFVGDKAAKEEVVTNNWWLKYRRIFLKLLMVYKSEILTTALIGLMPGGAFVLIAKLIMFAVKMARLKFYVKSVKAIALDNGEDDQRAKVRKRCIQELQLELRVTREKLEDAKADGNRKAKYDLMRIENKIEKEITRLRYSQDPDTYTGGRSLGQRSDIDVSVPDAHS